MPLQPVGVQYVSQGFNDFIKNMGTAGLAVVGLGEASEESNVAILEYAASLERLNKMGVDTSAVGRKISEGFKKSTEETKRSGNILKNYVSDLFHGFMGGIKTGWKVGAIAGTIVGLIQPEFMILTQAIGGLMGAFLGQFIGLVASAPKAVYELWKSIALAIAGGIGKVVKNIVQAGILIAEAFYTFGKRVITSIWGVIKGVGGIVKNLFDTLFGFLSGEGSIQGRGGWRGLGSSILTAMVKFELLKQTIRAVIGEIRDLAKAATDAAINVQTLTARLNFLVARNIQSADSTIEFDKALEMAVPQTQGLLKWISKLAMTTPVGVDDIANTYSLSMAMGWAAEEAKVLTKSIVDYTSATGLGSEISERIIYNFAQMKQQGKVTGTELRDLGRGAFMPINKILEIMYEDMQNATDGTKKFTGSFDEFKTAAAEGKVEVEGFFTAFNEFVGKYMPDAAYKMNYTFAAVMNNLQDLFKVLLGWNVLGPMVKAMTKPLQDFIEKMSSDAVLLSANRIGKAMAFLIESLRMGIGFIINAFKKLIGAAGIAAPTVENIVKTITKLGLAFQYAGEAIGRFLEKFLMPLAATIRNYFEPTFKAMNNDFFTFGANIVLNFAKGMIRAAAKFLTIAITYIAKILSFFFKPGSPPKVAPDIDKWGMETINEWLHGFTQADFSVLDDMKSVIKDALTALVDLGQMTDVRASELYVSYTVKLIDALDEFNKTGNIASGIFDELRNIGGVYGREVADLLDIELQLAVATEKATQAQIDYDNAIKASAKTEVKTNRLVREYNNMVRKGVNRVALKDKLKLVNASEIELGVNKKYEITAKSNLDLAQQQQKTLEDQIKLQQSLIKTLTDLATAQKEVTSGAGGMAEAIEEAITEAGAGYDWTLTDPTKDWDLEGWMREATAEFDLWWRTNMPSLSSVWYDNFVSPDSDFQKALAIIKPSITTAISGLKGIWDDFATHLKLPSWDEIASAWGSVPDIKTQIPAQQIPGQPQGFQPSNVFPFKTETVETPDIIGKFRAVVKVFTEAIKKDIESGGVFGFIKEIGLYFWDKLVGAITGVSYGEKGAGGVGGAAALGTKIATNKTSPAHATIMDLLNGVILDIQTAIAPGSKFREDLGKLADKVLTAIADGLFPKKKDTYSSGPGGKGDSPGQRILDGISAYIETNADKIKTIGGQLADYLWQGFTDWFSGTLPGRILGAMANETGIGPVAAIWQFFRDNPPTKSVDLSTWISGFDSTGADAASSLYTGFDTKNASLTWNTTFGIPIQSITDLWGLGHSSLTFQTFGEETAQSLYDGMNNLVTQTIDWSGLWVFVITKTREVLGIDKGTTSPFYLIGQSIVWGIIAGFQSMIETLKTEWNALVALLPEEFREQYDMDSPSKLFRGMGANIVKGLALGISDASPLANKAMLGLVDSPAFLNSVMRAPVSAPPVYAGNTVNFSGDVHINNGLDWQMFKAQVQRAIVEG